MRRIVLGLGLAIAAALADGTVSSAATAGAAKASWKVLPSISATVTPNYATGFGPQGGTGSGSTPAVGPLAVAGGGTVDFGTIVAGYQYIYKYAAQLTVKTNDSSGYKVFAEGSTDFIDTTHATILTMNSVLYWMLSSAANTQYSAATAFQSTTNTGDTAYNNNANGQGQNITFLNGLGNPPSSTVIYSSSVDGTSTQGFDYQIRVPDSITTTDTFTAVVVYTAVAN